MHDIVYYNVILVPSSETYPTIIFPGPNLYEVYVKAIYKSIMLHTLKKKYHIILL